MQNNVNKCGVLDKLWIFYGADEYDACKIREIDFNHRWMNKPLGGFWGSPFGSDFGWREFCLSNEYRVDDLSKHFLFRLSSDALIYVIDVIDDMDVLICDNGFGGYCLDFERLHNEGYDGVYVTKNAVISLRYNDKYIGCDLYSWDVESICIWNNDIIIPEKE